MNTETKFYKLTNGYPLRVRLTGERDGDRLKAEVLETIYGYHQGEIIDVMNVFLYDKF
jgi:hypothetical protein